MQTVPTSSSALPLFYTADLWLWFQIFGIFLARTLISDIEAVKAGHHF